jgi:hypothetical protein
VVKDNSKLLRLIENSEQGHKHCKQSHTRKRALSAM